MVQRPSEYRRSPPHELPAIPFRRSFDRSNSKPHDERVKLKLGLGPRRVARRVAAVDAYEFPSSVRQRLRLKHRDLGTESAALIEAATRQWFRILAQNPRARLSMPSLLVDDMWHEFLLHTRDYAAFCDTAFGRLLHRKPEFAITPHQAASNHSDHLLVTLELARQDENCWPELPLLFRVDHQVGLTGARRYLADCGGRGVCYMSTPNLVCLHHLAGMDRPELPRGPGPWRWIAFRNGPPT